MFLFKIKIYDLSCDCKNDTKTGLSTEKYLKNFIFIGSFLVPRGLSV